MINTKVIIYVFFFLKKSDVDGTEQTKWYLAKQYPTVIKGHVCFFTLREVQRSLLDGKDS